MIKAKSRTVCKISKALTGGGQEDDQPRLLLVAVDVADGTPITFNSYPKEDASRKTEYGKFNSHSEKEIGF